VQYLSVNIGHLRAKLRPATTLIRAEPGIGYRFGDLLRPPLERRKMAT
jgi:DNA-binding response OmpR family regulator